MNAREYYLVLQAAIQAAPHVLHSDLAFEEIDPHECYLRGVLRLIGNLELHVAVSTFPHHRHDDQGNPHASPAMSIPAVLEAVLPFIPS